MALEHKPFPDHISEEELERTHVKCFLKSDLDVEERPEKRTECWDCGWSPDQSLFVWPCGQRMVKLLPTDIIGDGSNGTPAEREMISIDCRQIVSSIAVGTPGNAMPPAEDTGYRMFHWENHRLILAIALRNGRIRIFDMYTARILLELIDHDDCVSGLRFAPDNSLMLASCSTDGTLKFWDLRDDGNMTKTFAVASYTPNRGNKAVSYIAWSPDATRLAAVGSFRTVVIFSTVQQQCVQRLSGHLNIVACCDFSPDGILLATTSWDTTCMIWNSLTGARVCSLGHQFPAPSLWFPGDSDTMVRSCKFTRGGSSVATVSSDGYVRFWELDSPSAPVAISQADGLLCCSVRPDSNVLACGTVGGSVLLIDVPRRIKSLAECSREVINRKLATGDGTVTSLPIPTSVQDYLTYSRLQL